MHKQGARGFFVDRFCNSAPQPPKTVGGLEKGDFVGCLATNKTRSEQANRRKRRAFYPISRDLSHCDKLLLFTTNRLITCLIPSAPYL